MLPQDESIDGAAVEQEPEEVLIKLLRLCPDQVLSCLIFVVPIQTVCIATIVICSHITTVPGGIQGLLPLLQRALQSLLPLFQRAKQGLLPLFQRAYKVPLARSQTSNVENSSLVPSRGASYLIYANTSKNSGRFQAPGSR